MKILVTGAEGFTGRYFVEAALNRGHEVIALKANLNDPTLLKQEVVSISPEAVIHLAGISFVGHGDTNDIYHTNILGTRNLLEALTNISSHPSSIILVSSASVYGNTLVNYPINESTQPKPANDYAVSKLAMEYMAQLWADRLPITIVRPFNYTGVGQSPNFLLPKIIDHYKRRASEIELGNLDVARDFSDVRVIVQIYCLLLEREFAGETFNICSGNSFSLRDILSLIAKISGYEINVQVTPAFVRHNEVKYQCGSNLKLINEIGDFNIISLEDTLRWMLYSK